jgi:AcrR family transcriptional regulator
VTDLAAPASTADQARTRAKPLSTDDRRAMIIDAVIPLLMEHGKAVTTRQIADAADIAEGTIFRVFGDKDALFEAAVQKFLDPTAANRSLRAIDPELPLEAKVNDILFQLRSRMTGIFGIMNAVGNSGPPPRRPNAENFEDVIADVLRPDLERLQLPLDRIASFVRLVAFASAIPHFNQGHEIATADLAHLITYGIAGHPAERGSKDVA